MMTAVRQTATVQADRRMTIDVPELSPGTVADVIVLAPVSPPPATVMTPQERVALWGRLREQADLSKEQAERWIQDIRNERAAWPESGEPLSR